jgi:periplasmic protein TonB
VIAAGSSRSGGQRGAHVQGWLVSVLLHGTVALAAILLVKQVPLAPQDEAFTWDVAMVLQEQVRPAGSPQKQGQTPFVPSTTSTPLHHIQQTASSQTLPLPQPIAQPVTPSSSKQFVTPARTEVPPLQPTTPSQSVANTTQPFEPIRHETGTSMVAEATSIVKPEEAPIAVSGESAAQTTPLNAPSAILEHTAQSDEAPAPRQMAAISPTPTSTPAKRDYGWLSEAILRRVEELKRYPASARVDRAEGKVVVKAVINEDGNVGEVEVFQSSGHPGLDKAAIDTLRQAAPFHLPRPLGQPGMTIRIPMSYRLDR